MARRILARRIADADEGTQQVRPSLPELDPIGSAPWAVSTVAAQSLGTLQGGTAGIVAPMHLTTTHLRDADNDYRSGQVYGHCDNPTVRQTQSAIAALEDADDALLFGSGMAAATTVILALDRPTHIVASEGIYFGLRNWLGNVNRFGHCVSFVDSTDLDRVRKAVRSGGTSLIWIETPSNPLWTITDIAAIADIAHRAGAMLCVDSTVSTPVLTRPLSLGADIVMHSATKYLNGHSDVIAGALAVKGGVRLWESIRTLRNTQGATLGPFEAWLLARGMRTLDVRVRAQSTTALALAHRLQGHPGLLAVLYPGLASHPGHAVAARQMTGGFGGMLSIRLRHGEQAAIEVAARVALWKRATSLGGVESLIEHRASIEGKGTRCPPDLLRLSVGLECVDDLHADLRQALAAVE